MSTDFERLGGAEPLRELISSFIDRVVTDTMIGFYFRDVDQTRLKEFEYQFAAEHLGGPVSYQGRDLGQAHGRRNIFGGQFDRRMRILQQVLSERGVPETIQGSWLAHDRALRAIITGGAECNA